MIFPSIPTVYNVVFFIVKPPMVDLMWWWLLLVLVVLLSVATVGHVGLGVGPGQVVGTMTTANYTRKVVATTLET